MDDKTNTKAQLILQESCRASWRRNLGRIRTENGFDILFHTACIKGSNIVAVQHVSSRGIILRLFCKITIDDECEK